jgi:hypothetical protein
MQHQTLYIDCIAGDMMLGALIDLGVPEKIIRNGLSHLNIEGYTLEVKRSKRHGIEGCDVRVEDHTSNSKLVSESDNAASAPSNMSNVPNTTIGSPSAHHTGHHHHHSPSRNWKDIRALIEAAALPGKSGELAIRIFERLAIAEGKIHGVDPETVHFHEVGGIDAIVDIVGTAIGIDWLAPSRVVSSPIPAPRGFVKCDHGGMPLPGPATFELLRGATIVGVEQNGEWVTPTGAAILTELADTYGAIPSMQPSAIGYGVGDRDPSTHANLLRLITGNSTSNPIATEEIVQLEATLDDMVPEWYGALADSLRNSGALDCWLTPVQMKKGRPGTQLSVLCTAEFTASLVEVIFRESTTLGVRIQTIGRVVAERRSVSVDTPFGKVRMKIASRNGINVNIAPEYDDCLNRAREHGVPVKDVYRAALSSHDLD